MSDRAAPPGQGAEGRGPGRGRRASRLQRQLLNRWRPTTCGVAASGMLRPGRWARTGGRGGGFRRDVAPHLAHRGPGGARRPPRGRPRHADEDIPAAGEEGAAQPRRTPEALALKRASLARIGRLWLHLGHRGARSTAARVEGVRRAARPHRFEVRLRGPFALSIGELATAVGPSLPCTSSVCPRPKMWTESARASLEFISLSNIWQSAAARRAGSGVVARPRESGARRPVAGRARGVARCRSLGGRGGAGPWGKRAPPGPVGPTRSRADVRVCARGPRWHGAPAAPLPSGGRPGPAGPAHGAAGSLDGAPPRGRERGWARPGRPPGRGWCGDPARLGS